MAFTITLLESGTTATASDPHTTGTFSPTEDAAIFCAVSMRADSGGAMFPAVPTDANGLTWTLIAALDHDNAGTQSQMRIYRAVVGESPGTFSLSIDSNSGDRGLGWIIFEIEGVDTSTNGGVVQHKAPVPTQVLNWDVTAVFDAAPDAANATIMFTAIQTGNAQTWTHEAGFTQLEDHAPFDNEIMLVTYDLTSALTTVEQAWTTSTGFAGLIAVEIKLSSGTPVSGTINGGGSITASVTKYTNQVARPASTVTAGDWDTGPTTGQNLHDYAGDDSDATYIEDTTV